MTKGVDVWFEISMHKQNRLLLKTHSKHREFYTHTVFQDAFLRETEKQKESYSYILG